jgi:DNA polymerase III alpha subunit
LDIFDSRKQLEKMLSQEPDWEMLEREEVVKELFHLSKHFSIVSKIKPGSIEDLADILALIRPNKIHLLDKYLQDKESIRKVLYHKIDASDLRKSHALAYALNIKLQLNYIKNYETNKRS